MNEKNTDIKPGHGVALFQEKTIRRTWHEKQWWFAVADVVAVLTDSVDPIQYIKKLRSRDNELAQGWVQIVTPLRIETEGGIQRINCANTEGLLRIIQSIPSPKAEPFKRWLAKVGFERIQEIENPELASARARALCLEKRAPRRSPGVRTPVISPPTGARRRKAVLSPVTPARHWKPRPANPW